MQAKITPVVLCGGSGTRLWPLSRRSFPKQFVQLIGDGSLFQQAALRLASDGFEAPVIVTGSDFRFIVTQQLAEIGIDPAAVLVEPAPRNTAPALLAATLRIAQSDPDALILASPSDHFMTDDAALRASVQRGRAVAEEGRIVTFGITPDAPLTNYGYLELAEIQGDAIPLKTFVEKPDEDRAAEMLVAGNYLWNAGLFLAKASTLIAAYEAHAPDMLRAVQAALDAATPDLGLLRLAPGPWADCEDISVDFAIMEKADNLSVFEHSGDWSDLGSWEAVMDHSAPDADGVATSGGAMAFGCRDTLLRSEADGVRLVGLGLDHIVAIAVADAVLIADRDRIGQLGDVVKTLRSEGIAQADSFPKDHRPWGHFERLIKGDRFQVKRIVVAPGGILSLQSHLHRAEHWIVVEGTARVTIGDDVRLISENQSVYVPLGETHRLENPGKVMMTLIEVQTGTYLGEDDIERHDDAYARCPDD